MIHRNNLPQILSRILRLPGTPMLGCKRTVSLCDWDPPASEHASRCGILQSVWSVSARFKLQHLLGGAQLCRHLQRTEQQLQFVMVAALMQD